MGTVAAAAVPLVAVVHSVRACSVCCVAGVAVAAADAVVAGDDVLGALAVLAPHAVVSARSADVRRWMAIRRCD